LDLSLACSAQTRPTITVIFAIRVERISHKSISRALKRTVTILLSQEPRQYLPGEDLSRGHQSLPVCSFLVATAAVEPRRVIEAIMLLLRMKKERMEENFMVVVSCCGVGF